jgi:hypothetical protein
MWSSTGELHSCHAFGPRWLEQTYSKPHKVDVSCRTADLFVLHRYISIVSGVKRENVRKHRHASQYAPSGKIAQ